MNKKARLIAFYLPQYHPIPENDEWWGKGFTEWTNVTKAKPMFRGHYQPRIPADVGFYDLRVPETRELQAQLAKEYGIEGFCYWHYWFGNGKRLLERPFNEVLNSGKPEFPFCLAWANESWTGIWHGVPDRILIEQSYPRFDDFKAHFYSILNAFHDKRYMTVNGKKIFVVYCPYNLPNPKEFTDQWRELADKEGLKGIHFIGITDDRTWKPEAYGFDAVVQDSPFVNIPQINVFLRKLKKLKKKYFKLPDIYLYKELVTFLNNQQLSQYEYPIVIPDWDNTPRSNKNGLVLHNSTPELFEDMLQKAIIKIENIKNPDQKIIFIKSWNEWAESNYLEPDIKYGHAYLQVIKDNIFNLNV